MHHNNSLDVFCNTEPLTAYDKNIFVQVTSPLNFFYNMLV